MEQIKKSPLLAATRKRAEHPLQLGLATDGRHSIPCARSVCCKTSVQQQSASSVLTGANAYPTITAERCSAFPRLFSACTHACVKTNRGVSFGTFPKLFRSNSPVRLCYTARKCLKAPYRGKARAHLSPFRKVPDFATVWRMAGWREYWGISAPVLGRLSTPSSLCLKAEGIAVQPRS